MTHLYSFRNNSILRNKFTVSGLSPSADTAVKIAKVLHVSVEYLVTGQNQALKNEGIDIKKYKEYSDLIAKLDTLNENQKDLVKTIITQMTEWKG